MVNSAWRARQGGARSRHFRWRPWLPRQRLPVPVTTELSRGRLSGHAQVCRFMAEMERNDFILK